VARRPGNVVEIPLGEGRRGFARDLGLEVEFYDCQAARDEVVDVEGLEGTPVAFRVMVMDSAFKPSSTWRSIGKLPLGADQSPDSRFAKQDPLTGALSIYREDSAAGTWHEEPATLEECAGLEVAAVWSAEHVEDRLRDHFSGTPDKWSNSMAIDASALPPA
jgi:hypothetical protein